MNNYRRISFGVLSSKVWMHLSGSVYRVYTSRIRGLKILETYTAKTDTIPLPDFLEIEREITKDKSYSMHTLSRKESADAPSVKANRSLDKGRSSPINFAKFEIPNRSNGEINGLTNKEDTNGESNQVKDSEDETLDIREKVADNGTKVV